MGDRSAHQHLPFKVSPGMPFELLAHRAVDFWLCGEVYVHPRSARIRIVGTRPPPNIVLVIRQARPALVVNEAESATEFVEVVDHKQHYGAASC